MAHALLACDDCGSVDDHPKLHSSRLTPGYTVKCETYHHDCVPDDILDGHPADHPLHAIVAAARSGVHGDALRTFITGGEH